MRGGKQLSQEQWSRLLEEYRHSPADHGHVARVTGVNKRTCIKYWLRGGSMPYSTTPIRDLIAAEQDQIRALRQRTREEEARQEAKALGRLDAILARNDRIQQRVGELELIGMLKTNVIDMIALQADLLLAADQIRVEMRAALVSPEMRARIKENPTLGVQLMKAITNLVSEGSKAAELVMKLERLVMGEPTETKLVQFESVDQAAAAIARAQAAAERRGLKLIDAEVVEHVDPTPKALERG